ncbi:YhdP family protein [Ferrimonas pelagia]|uniref:YhdP family protein n=1 Tax=Ferrimonas pelagia TaxID=1177826 RepID=A0ABP9FFY7_9GAMM
MSLIQLCQRFGRWCWYSLAAALVVLALVISLVRSLLPQLDGIRTELVSWAEQQTGLELELAQLGAGWHGGGPQLSLEELYLPAQPGLPLALNIERLEVQLDFWASVLQLSPQIELVRIQGVELDLAFSGERAQSQRDLQPLRELMLHQLGDLQIRDLVAHVAVQDRALEPIHLAELNWRNRGDRHLGEGLIYLDEAQRDDEQLTLALELNSQADGRLQGQIYVNAERLDLGDWLSRRFSLGDHPYQGVLDLEAWASIDNDALGQVQVQLDNSYFSWQLEREHKIAVHQGQFVWQPGAEGGLLTAHRLQLESDDQHWPDTEFALRHRTGTWDLRLGELPLWGLQPLTALIPGLEPQMLEALAGTDAQGQIGPFRLQQDQGEWLGSVQLQDIGWQQSGPLPGVSPLSGSLHVQQGWFRAQLPPQALSLDWPSQFIAPLELERFALQLEGFPLREGWQVRLTELALANGDLNAQLQATLGLEPERAPQLQLYGNVALDQAAALGRYLPRGAMGAPLADYLADALQAGRSDNAQILWHGALDQYPYAAGQGRFLAGFDMHEVTFDFLDEWPAVTDGHLTARFDNARMDIRVNEAKLAGVALEEVHIAIPQLDRTATLEIDGSLLADPDKAQRVLAGTFLGPTIGTTLELVQIQDAVPLSLNMRFFLGAEVTEQPDEIHGRLAFWNTPVYLQPLDLDLEQVRGELRFLNDRLEISGLQARIYNQPTELALLAESRDDGYGIDIDLSSRWQMSRLPPLLSTPLDPFMIGGIGLDGRVSLRIDDEDFDYTAELRSDLVGLALTLPTPLAKEVEQPLNAVLALSGDAEGSEVFLTLEDRLQFVGDMSYDGGAGFDRYHLALEQAQAALPDLSTALISVRSDRINLGDYQPLVMAFADAPATEQSTRRPLLPAIDKIQIDSDALSLLGQSFGAGRIVTSPNRDGWGVQIDAENVMGQALIGQGEDQLGIQLNAERLHLLLDDEEDGVEAELASYALAEDIADLPALDVSVAKLQVNDLDLGEVRFLGYGNGPLYRIEQLNVGQGEHQLKAQGTWRPEGEFSRTRLVGEFSSPDIGELAEVMQMTPVIDDADLALEYRLEWAGAPWEFAKANLDGDLSYRMGSGKLSDVSDRGARLLSLFSLESLVRRLSLDFTDVFSSGLHFNRFSGTVQFDDGVLHTEDSVMDATAGTMRVNGWTDLNQRTLDYQISFSPALTSSVPAVVYLSTGAWTVGLGAFAVSKILEPVIEVITQLRYHLSGTLEDPQLEEISRTSREIRLPEQAQQAELGSEDVEAQAEAIQEALIDALEAQQFHGEETDADPSAPAQQSGRAEPQPEPDP